MPLLLTKCMYEKFSKAELRDKNCANTSAAIGLYAYK